MQPITTTKQLTEACARLAKYPFVTVDTEFQRETTYYPMLCIAQIASNDEAVVWMRWPRTSISARSGP